MTVSILWFRRDLRIHDNAAFQWVCEHSSKVIPVYIHAPEEEEPWQPGAASRWWLYNSLLALEKKLAEYGLKFHYFSGNSEEVISEIIDKKMPAVLFITVCMNSIYSGVILALRKNC